MASTLVDVITGASQSDLDQIDQEIARHRKALQRLQKSRKLVVSIINASDTAEDKPAATKTESTENSGETPEEPKLPQRDRIKALFTNGVEALTITQIAEMTGIVYSGVYACLRDNPGIFLKRADKSWTLQPETT